MPVQQPSKHSLLLQIFVRLSMRRLAPLSRDVRGFSSAAGEDLSPPQPVSQVSCCSSIWPLLSWGRPAPIPKPASGSSTKATATPFHVGIQYFICALICLASFSSAQATTQCNVSMLPREENSTRRTRNASLWKLASRASRI